jgi:hypothetical protein
MIHKCVKKSTLSLIICDWPVALLFKLGLRIEEEWMPELVTNNSNVPQHLCARTYGTRCRCTRLNNQIRKWVERYVKRDHKHVTFDTTDWQEH